MRTEEKELMPAAEKALSASDWAERDAAFEADRDPLAGSVRDRQYDRISRQVKPLRPAGCRWPGQAGSPAVAG